MCGCRLEAWVDGCFRSQIICLRNEWVSRKCTWTPDRQVLCAVPGWSDTLFSCIRSFSAVCKKQKCWRNKSKLLHGWKKKKNLTQSWCDCQSLSSFHQMHIIFYQTLCSSGHKTQHMNSVCVSVCVSVCQCVSVCGWKQRERTQHSLISDTTLEICMPAAVTQICMYACKHSEIRWEKICATEQDSVVWGGRAGGGAAEAGEEEAWS